MLMSTPQLLKQGIWGMLLHCMRVVHSFSCRPTMMHSVKTTMPLWESTDCDRLLKMEIALHLELLVLVCFCLDLRWPTNPSWDLQDVELFVPLSWIAVWKSMVYYRSRYRFATDSWGRKQNVNFCISASSMLLQMATFVKFDIVRINKVNVYLFFFHSAISAIVHVNKVFPELIFQDSVRKNHQKTGWMDGWMD